MNKLKEKAMKRRNPIHAYKRLLAKDYDWDYAYLIALEKKKLQRLHDCIKRENHLVNNEFVVREIAICIRLIDIFMENDAVYNTWLDRLGNRDLAIYATVSLRQQKALHLYHLIREYKLLGWWD